MLHLLQKILGTYHPRCNTLELKAAIMALEHRVATQAALIDLKNTDTEDLKTKAAEQSKIILAQNEEIKEYLAKLEAQTLVWKHSLKKQTFLILSTPTKHTKQLLL